jgi:hypothetical protein
VGQGSTDDNGHYNIYWQYPGLYPEYAPYIKIVIATSHAGGRFSIGISNGATPTAASGGFYPIHGGTKYIGGLVVGSSGAPHWHFNAYWAAERVWREAFGRVGVLSAYMTNVDIRGFADNIPGFLGQCGTSCADGPNRRVQLDAGAGLAPQARVMHEYGHVASYFTHNFLVYPDYCWPDTYCANPGWGQTTPEWGMDGFEEAFATLGPNVTFWDPNAINPTTCWTTTHCFA